MGLGWRTAADANDDSRRFGLAMNPAKSCAATFTAEDRVIVLADPDVTSTSANDQARRSAST